MFQSARKHSHNENERSLLKFIIFLWTVYEMENRHGHGQGIISSHYRAFCGDRQQGGSLKTNKFGSIK